MRRIVFIIIALLAYTSAFSANLFPFNEVNHKINLSLNGGYNFGGKAGVYGIGVTFRGFHVTIGGVGSTHENDMDVDVWNEKSTFILRAGYQIPIVKAFRIIPLFGTAADGEVSTNGYDYEVGHHGVSNKVEYDLKYRFDYGVQLVFNHRKLIINACLTRYTATVGVGIEF